MSGNDRTCRRRRDRATLDRITRGLRMVTVPFPHLAGLAAAVRVAIDDSVPTMGVFASGRLVANPAFTARLSDADLAVRAGARAAASGAAHPRPRASARGHLEFNYAHDYIINDMLRHALGVPAIPAGGLDMPGARDTIGRRDRARDAPQRQQPRRRARRSGTATVVTVDQVLGAASQRRRRCRRRARRRARARDVPRATARSRRSAPAPSGISPPRAWRSPQPSA